MEAIKITSGLQTSLLEGSAMADTIVHEILVEKYLASSPPSPDVLLSESSQTTVILSKKPNEQLWPVWFVAFRNYAYSYCV